MPYERVLTEKAPARGDRDSPAHPPIAQIVFLLLALLATLALWTLVQAPAGLQQLLLLCLLRLAVLVGVGALSYRAFSRRRAEASTTPGGGATPRTNLVQAVLCLQLAWLASELLLGSGLLLFYPNIVGGSLAEGVGVPEPATSAVLALLPLVCAAIMSGCFLFLQRLTSRRRRHQRAASHLECGGSSVAHHPLHQLHSSSACCGCTSSACAASCGSHSVDIICSPVSDAGSFSSCNSSGSCTAAYYSRSSSGRSSVTGNGGAPSPTGHVRSLRGSVAAQHEAAIQAACEILLVEHQLDTMEFVMFVHKKLRPIKTRPEEKAKAPQPGLLRDLITNSFTFQHDPELASQLATAALHGAPGGSGDVSGACSITFQAAAAAGGLTAM